jgi:flagellar basal-body rod protein FlgG
MVRGIYTAESGLLTTIRSINVKSNNLANLSTAGFKQDRLVTSTFAEALAVRQEVRTTGQKQSLGYDAVRGWSALELQTDFTQGSLAETQRNLDFAISGNGFFTIESRRTGELGEELTYGGKYYTRNGQFQIDPEGFLIDGLGNYVLDIYDSRIFIGRYDFTSDDSGNLFAADGLYIATLAIFNPSNPEILFKNGEETFSILNENFEPEELLPFDGRIIQGHIERPNTDIASQMASLISSSRHFQSLTQIIRAIDAAVGRSVTEIGRV